MKKGLKIQNALVWEIWILLSCILVGCIKETERPDAYLGGIYTYIPQALNLKDSEFFDVLANKNNYTMEDGKLKVRLSVKPNFIDKTQNIRVGFNGNIKNTDELIQSFNDERLLTMPQKLFSITKEAIIKEGEEECDFFLVIDSSELKDNQDLSDKKLILLISLDKLDNNYSLAEDLSSILVSVDVDEFREIFFSPTPGLLYREGKDLMLNGKVYKSIGIDGLQAIGGCGLDDDQTYDYDGVEKLFASLPPNILVRTQAFAWQYDDGWIASVIELAEKYDIKLILSLLEGKNQGCGSFWVSSGWYENDYKESGFLEYLAEVASKYKNSTAIGMWEIADHPSENYASSAILGFLDESAKVIKANDPNHLVASGVMGEINAPGTKESYKELHESEYIDVGTMWDDNWMSPNTNHAIDIEALNELDKPGMVHKVDVYGAAVGENCSYDIDFKTDMFKQKVDKLMNGLGFQVVLSPYMVDGNGDRKCTWSTQIGDPIFEYIINHPLNNINYDM